jgi:hypothetical protein
MKKKPAVLQKKVRQLRASQPIESGSAKRTPAVLPRKVRQIHASKPTKSSVRKNKVSGSAKNKTPVFPEKVQRFCGSWTVTDDHVLPMEAMGCDNDEGFCDKPAVTPVLPTKAMIDDDDGTVSEAMEAMVQDNNDVLMDTMVNDNNDGIDHSDLGMLNCVGVLPALPELPELPPFPQLDEQNETVSRPPLTTMIQHNGGKRHAPRVAAGAKSRNAKKANSSSGTIKVDKRTSRVRAGIVDPLVNKVVAFLVSSELGKQIITLLGGAWTESAISHGYIIGIITRKSSLKMQGCNDSLYDVAWEYSDFGETAFSSSVLVEAVNAGREIVQL